MDVKRTRIFSHAFMQTKAKRVLNALTKIKLYLYYARTLCPWSMYIESMDYGVYDHGHWTL